MLPFLLILIAILALGLQYSNASVSVTEADESTDTSEARSQESSEIILYELDGAGAPTGGYQTGGEVLEPDIPPFGINVVIVVTFNSVTVHNKHEGALSGDGEYDLVAYVQGKKVDLTHASGLGAGLSHVSNGETVNFMPGTQIITEIPETFPLSIFTLGSEVDGCGRVPYPDNIQKSLPIFNDPRLDWSSAISNFDKSITFRFLGNCGINLNDILGTIKEFYDPPNHGVGPHAVKSSSSDFTLRYTISLSAPELSQNKRN